MKQNKASENVDNKRIPEKILINMNIFKEKELISIYADLAVFKLSSVYRRKSDKLNDVNQINWLLLS